MIHIGDYWPRGSKEQFACVAEGALVRGAGSEYHQPFALDDILPSFLVRWHPIREATKTVDNPDDLLGRS
jgi:hypothetical protein